MSFWLTLLYTAIASYTIGGLLAQFPDDVAPDDGDPFGSPQSQPGSPVPIVFGTRRIKGINMLWYGKVSSKAIKKKFKAGFKKKKVTIGYKYFVAMQVAISYSFFGMLFRELYVGEDVIFSSAVSSNNFVDINKGNLYGGKKQGGGLVGRLRFQGGFGVANIPPVVQHHFGVNPDLPLYINTAQFTLSSLSETSGFYIGTQKQIKQISVVISNTDFAGNGEPYNDSVIIGTTAQDVNPITVLREILISDIRFLNLSSNEVDIPALDVAEQQIYDERLFFSPIFSNPKSVEKMIEVILKLIDGVFYPDPLSGKMTLKLLRQTDITGSEIILDGTNILRVIKSKIPEETQTINEVKLTYTDRTHGYENRTITAQNLAGFINNNSVHNTKVLNFSSITSNVVARFVCDRELTQLSKPLITLQLECNRELAETRVGDLLLVNKPELKIINVYFRVSDIDYGNLPEGSIVVELLEDLYTDNVGLYNEDQVTEFVDPVGIDNTVEITNAQVLELPRRLLNSLVDITDTIDNDWSAFISSINAASGNFSFDIYLDDLGGSSYVLSDSDVSFTPSAILESDYIKETLFFDNTETQLRIFFPDIDLELIDEVVSDLQNQGSPERYFLLNNEYIAYTNIVDLGSGIYSLSDLRRGLFDTIPDVHLAGSIILFLSDDEPVLSEGSFSVIDNPNINIKLDPLGLAGNLGLENVTEVDNYISIDRAQKPLPVGNLKFNNIIYPIATTPVYEDTVITWEHRDKNVLEGMVFQDTTGHTKETNVSYTIEIFESDGTTLLRTIAGITVNTHTYTKDQEFTDHGKHDRLLIFVLTSVDSVKGDCLFPREQEVNYRGFGFDFGNDFGN